MQATAEAITQCKFEATDPAADEVVLYKILQVGTLLLCWICQCRPIKGRPKRNPQ